MAVTDEVVQMIKAGRDSTVQLTDAQVLALTGAWVEAWDELQPVFDDALQATVAVADGPIPASVMARDRRITQALLAARAALEDLQVRTEEIVAQDVPAATLNARDAHLASLQAQLPPEAPGIVLGRLDDDALAVIVARTTQQIHASVLPLSAESAAAMRAELIKGITVGSNPRRVASRMLARTEGAFNGGLTRATRIARTEMLDAHRTTQLQSVAANRSVLAERIWIATFDSRTCGSCLGQHGSTWPLEAFGPEDHPNGRCIFVDKTKSWEELGFTGIDSEPRDDIADRDAWWENQTEQSQDALLGKPRADLLRSGEISWTDLSTRNENPEWRPSYALTPLKDLPTP